MKLSDSHNNSEINKSPQILPNLKNCNNFVCVCRKTSSTTNDQFVSRHHDTEMRIGETSSSEHSLPGYHLAGRIRLSIDEGTWPYGRGIR